jgi:hypothetical protein
MLTRKFLTLAALVTQGLVDKIVTILEGELPLSDGRR